MSGTDFQTTLERYKTNLVQYKATGNQSFKTASDTDKKWLDEYVASLQSNVEKGNNDIRKFVQSYAQSDEELAKIKRDMASVRKEAPQLQTMYETEHESQKQAPLDYTLYYTKGAVIAGIAGLLLVARMF